MKLKNSHIAGLFLLIAGVVYAGNQYNWGNSNGGSWSTPDDTTVKAGQVLQIGNSGGPVVTAAGGPLTLFSGSSTTILGLTPSTTGQIVFLSAGAAANSLCISTGVATGAWALLTSTTSICK